MYLRRSALYFIAPLLVTIAVVIAFDRYLVRTSRDLLDGWLKSEAVSIQEGQILSAITKKERVLKSSMFLRGVQIVDDSAYGEMPRVMADFGKTVLLTKGALPRDAGEIVTDGLGIFHQVASYRFPKRRDLVVVFDIAPPFVSNLVIVNILAILAIFLVSALALRRSERLEADERVELIKKALNSLAAGGSPDPELVSQVPRLVDAWTGMQAELKRANVRERITFSRAKLGAFAKQASHDLNSPFTAVDVAVKSILNELTEVKRIEIRNALSGLRDLINSLHEKSKAVNLSDDASAVAAGIEPDAPGEATLCLLPTLVDQQLSISRLQYKTRANVAISAELGSESYGIFARVNVVEFRRVLANLITNAVEAIEHAGAVTVTLRRERGEIMLRVIDTGKGIGDEMLAHVGEPGVTDKLEGSGSGLHFCRNVVRAWGGTLSIRSKVGVGTTVQIALPEAKAPAWFVPELKIPAGSTVVVLDDDPAIHGVWKSRIDALSGKNCEITIVSFTMVTQIIEAMELAGASHASQCLYLCDFELAGSSETGLDVIERLGIASQAILVTSHADDNAVVSRCLRLGCRMLPKSAAGLVPIQVSTPLRRPDYVLIDDDSLIHQAWSRSAADNKKTLSKFFSVDEFLAISDDFDRTTPVYVDSHLGDGIKGEDMARYIRSAGFQSIYLQTGQSPEVFTKPMPWIKAIVDKTPPWLVRT